MRPPSRTAEQFMVRFPDGMRDRIAEAAKANNRSMNSEIVARLGASFASAPETSASIQATLFDEKAADFATRLAAVEKLMPAMALLEKLQPVMAWAEKNKPLLATLEKIKPAQELAEKIKAAQNKRPPKKG